MSDKERLQLEQECLFKYSKAQVINLYLDELDENEQLKSILTEIENMCKEEYYERNTIDIDSIVLSSHLDAKIYLKIKELKEKYK